MECFLSDNHHTDTYSEMDPDNYQPAQVGGGHHSSSLIVQTPTRRGLRPVVKATPRANATVRRANERCAKMQEASEFQHSEHPARPPSRALPAIPQSSAQQPSLRGRSPILPKDSSTIYATREPLPLSSNSCAPIVCSSSLARSISGPTSDLSLPASGSAY